MTDKQRDDLLISMSQGVMVLQTSINEFRKEFKDADERLYNDLYNKISTEVKATSDIFRNYFQYDDKRYDKINEKIIELNKSKK